MEKTESTYGLNNAESMASIHQPRQQQLPKNRNHLVSPHVKHKIKSTVEFIRNLKLEALLLFYVAAFSMRLIVTQDLLLTKACLQLNHTLVECNSSEEIKSETEKVANTANLFTTLVQLIPSAVLSIFVGTWSDKYGNKMPILVAIAGGLISDLGNVFIALSLRSSLYWSVLAALPNGLSGGLVCVWAAVYSHATKTTRPDMRTIKFLMITLAMQLGFPLGQFITGQVLYHWGYVHVYATSFTILLGCFVWMVIVVRGQKNPGVSTAAMVKYFFRLENFFEGVKTTIKERPNGGRKQILLMLTTMCIIVLNAETTRSVTFYFVKKQYNWTVTKYTEVTTIFALVNLVSIGPLVLILTKVLKIRDITLSIIGVTSMLIQNFTRGIAYEEWMYYVSGILGTAGTVSALGVTSHVSRMVSPNEIARMFSFWAACEAMVPVLGDVMASQVFNATIDAFPGSPFIISSLLLVLPLGSLVYCYRKTPDDSFEHLQNEEADVNCAELATSPTTCHA